MQRNEQEFLWVERYRPQRIEDCIMPDAQKRIFQDQLAQGEIQNMLLCGGAGMGKTTVARALCEELGADYLIINGSEESGIDVLRTKIKQFASTVSFSGRPKVVILDEADYLNPNSTQPALRAFIEEFSANCRFILTCNFRNRIIPPLHSRCAVVEFVIEKRDRPRMATAFFRRVQEILQLEGITATDSTVARLIERHFPDYRRVLNELQRHAVGGRIADSVVTAVADSTMQELVTSLQERDWKKMRSWVVNNSDNDPAALFRRIYDSLLDRVNSVPQLVLLLADYQYKAAFCADQEINLVACLTEIMATAEWKS